MLPYFVSRSCPKQKLRRTASPPYHGSAFLAYGHAAQDKKAPCLAVAVLCFSLVPETKAAPNRFAALSRLSVSRIRPRGTRQKSTLFAGVRTLFLARARNKSCAEPLRRLITAQRFSHTATRHKTKQTPFAGVRTLFLARARNKSCAEPLRRLITAQRFSHTATRHAKKQTPFGGGRTLFLARARNKSCAEPLRRSIAAQRFSQAATRHKTKKHPVGCFFAWCRWPDSNRHGIATGGF